MALDYVRLGFKCGIEIHQQLAGRKLFCECPVLIQDGKPERKIRRNLRAVVGETGDIDAAALHEHRKAKDFVYDFYKESNCLVELDEEPPHDISSDAVEAALMVAKMLNAKVVDDIQVMRKTVVDGSNTSGFQRTALIATAGCFMTSEGLIHVPTLCLEEEAAKIVERTPEYDEYNLSRLGIPLIEIGTAPDIKSSEGAKEAAEKLGMMLRSTKKVLRGIGTIRQDVNISIKDGARIEIKGAQDLHMLPMLCEYEAMRQHKLLSLKGNLSVDKEKVHVVSSIFKNTSCGFIKKALEGKDKKNEVWGFRLKGFRGKLGEDLCPGNRIGTEIARYLKVKVGLGGMIHSDEQLEKYKISDAEIEQLKSILQMKEHDAFALLITSAPVAEDAYHYVLERLNQLNAGVPSEVRKANDDGTTEYLRPMPGAARMYPETDVQTVAVGHIHVDIPELLEEQAKRIAKQYALSDDLAEFLASKDKIELFVHLAKQCKNLKPAFIAEVMLPKMREIHRKYNVDTEKIKDEDLASVLKKVDEGSLPKENIEDVLVKLAKGEKMDFSAMKAVDGHMLEKEIKAIIAQHKGATEGALMGFAMQKFRGKVDGKKVSEMVKKFL